MNEKELVGLIATRYRYYIIVGRSLRPEATWRFEGAVGMVQIALKHLDESFIAAE